MSLSVAKVERSFLQWDVELLPRTDKPDGIPAVPDDDPWAFARKVDAAYVRTLHQKQPVGDPSRGTALYDSYCWTCHGKTGKGDGPIAVTFKPRPRDLTDRTSLAKRTDRDLYNVISRGGGAVGPSPTMPAWGGVLAPQEIWDLVADVRQFATQP